jgi:predicted NBD/HSP70 family sugar kinase
LTATRRGVLRKSDVRETNERLILNLIRQNADVSRSDIVRITGLSPSSVTFIVNRMIGDGLIGVQRKRAQAQPGRPPISLFLRERSMYAIAVEISRMGARIVGADVLGRTVASKRVSWHANPEVFLARVRDGISTLTVRLSGKRLLGVGVGIPGTLNRSGDVVVAAENLGWFNVDASRILSDGVQTKVVLENDAKLAAFAERWFHAPGATPLTDFVFVATRGGLGTGVFVNGHLLRGASGEASEFGHTILYPDGRMCICGGQGCWEEYASDRAVARMYEEHGGSRDTAAEEVVRRARSGESRAATVLAEVSVNVGLGFVNIRQVFDPQAIIVGNYLAEGWDLIGNTVWKVLRARTASRHLDTMRIVPARYSEDSTLRGAIAIVLSQYFGTFTAAAGQKHLT